MTHPNSRAAAPAAWTAKADQSTRRAAAGTGSTFATSQSQDKSARQQKAAPRRLDRDKGLTESRGELAETDQPKEDERDLPGSARRRIWGAEGQPGAGHESRSGRNDRSQNIEDPISSRPEQGAECDEGRHAQKNQGRALGVDKSQHSDPTIVPHNSVFGMRGAGQ